MSTESPAPRASRASMVGELWQFLKARKLWWILPVLVALVLVGLLLIAAQGSMIAPFVYTLF